MEYSEFFSFSDSDDHLKGNITKSSESLKPGDIVISKGDLAGVQSVRHSINGGTTIDLVTKTGRSVVVRAKDLPGVTIVKSGKDINTKSLDMIECEEIDRESYDNVKDAIKNIGGKADIVIEKLDSDEDDDSSEKANKIANLAKTINSIEDHMQENSMKRSGMSSYRVNTV